MSIGIKDLRDGLSRHLALVRRGHTITITDHGKVIARIVPEGGPTVLEALVRDGVVTPAAGTRNRPEPLPASGTVSDLVADQRR